MILSQRAWVGGLALAALNGCLVSNDFERVPHRAASAGATSHSGGTATGGVSTGGVSTGGVSTGGVSTGGTATGGVSTGGTATGGTATGGTATNLSCAGLASCGTESCCAARLLPAGTFPRGRSNSGNDASVDGASDEQPEHAATLSAFELDAYEVTVGRFRNFMTAYRAGWRPTAGDGALQGSTGAASGWAPAFTANLATGATRFPTSGAVAALSTWTPSPSGSESLPINHVDWYQALAFCIYDGKRLPTETESEYAAAGGSENRLYPWGSGASDGSQATSGCWKLDCLTPVGAHSAGTGKYLTYDLASSVYEWVFDFSNPSQYVTLAAGCSGLSCVQLSDVSGGKRRLRGGAVSSNTAYFRAAFRFDDSPYASDWRYGIRCARNVP